MEGKPAGRTHCKVCSKGLGAAHSDSGLQMNPWFFTFKKRQVKVKVKSCLTLCDPWTIAHQAPPSVEFSRQEYWSGLPFPSPGDLPDPGIEPRPLTLQADALTSAPPGKQKDLEQILNYFLRFSVFLNNFILKTKEFCGQSLEILLYRGPWWLRG